MDDMTSIDALEVRAMGQAVDGVGERLVAVAGEIRTWEYEGRGAVEGAVMCDVMLAVTARAWEVTVDGLGQLVREFGHDLRTAAGDFVAVDQDIAERVRGVGKPWE
ncbi:hypothetical protein Aab01nite_31000 [Paractinoplanes abujensis]|uniref:Excreted virulence factor EspC (Type VII ESX diderm) n=1 Tax=Paractinoplanes abujensis TaxID=882441 RepID=A0A7W7G8J3_9ACTN|nr:hypothetical protein [Actinoplanes abujensis]MBB4698006.1 hypothetical protein [Actinoplanes abujensis]GID19510.1 hypothetical protein Aab01nite_31000 [Actinoplanes abujensis]